MMYLAIGVEAQLELGISVSLGVSRSREIGLETLRLLTFYLAIRSLLYEVVLRLSKVERRLHVVFRGRFITTKDGLLCAFLMC